ncbi:MAG: T9SS type A sorting domain-containing protein, partial [Flavobacteriales bacterium]
NQWRTDTVNLSAWSGQPNVQVAFRNKGDWGNILYLDNINLGSSVGIAEQTNLPTPKVYPNPICPGATLRVDPIPNSILSLFDAKGKLVWKTLADHAFHGALSNELKSGWYVLQIESEKTIWNYKLVVE